jgi:hypothetical protein
MKIVIDDNLQGKELFKFLVENKSQLIAQKKALPKKCDPIGGLPSFFNIKGKEAIKTNIGEIPMDASTVRSEIVANAAWWMDSQKDVLLSDCWAKTIADGNGRLHLKDHNYELDSEVGDVADIYSKNISLTELGLNKAGFTQCLIYLSDVQKAYDEKTFIKYKTGKVNQHSIGLMYGRIQLAVNDEEYKDEFATWNKYFDRIINGDEALASGYFFAVPEIKLIEVSAVVAGANRLTPTLYVGAKNSFQNAKTDTVIEPEVSTHEQPLQKSEAFDIQQLLNIF